MKGLLRKMTRKLTGFVGRVACETFGEKAELSSGPCGRCVGKRVVFP